MCSLAWSANGGVPEAAKRLDAITGKRAKGDATELIGRLVAAYEDASTADQVIAVRALGKAAGAKDVPTRHAAFRALAKLRVEGSGKYLNRWMSPPKKGTVHESHFKAIEAAGEIADPKTLVKLWKLGDHKNIDVAVAATRALAGYRTLPVKKRKKLAIDLVRRLEKNSSGGVRGRAGGPGRPPEADQAGVPYGRRAPGSDDRAAHLRHAIARTLETLTGARCTSVPEWVSWRKRAKRMKDPFAETRPA